MKYLPNISKLKTWSIEELNDLALEIRSRIISVLSVNGGHLSSNLGIVELSIALHYIFDSPSDQLIFDVSHQTYVHKLLTGRNSRFDQIRQYQGLCGFSDPEESKHDHFYAGHAGTALSLSLGAAKSRDLEEKSFHVIPILGDASLTCGVTLEALNNIPENLKKFLVILNDNEMSISENVGNIKNILSRLINHPFSNKIFHDIRSALSKVPGCGDKLAKQGQKLTESMKNLVSPAVFFEQFGLNYVGPIDGHDLPKLISTFKALKDIDRPVIVHVMTVKGKGMPAASKNPTTYHGAKPFDTESGQFLPSKKKPASFPKVFGETLLNMAEKNSSIVAITPAMPAGSCLTDFMKKYPERCFDVGIAESHSVTFAGGLAKSKKLKVFVAIYATFLQRALDNVFHDVCLQNLPVVFAIDRAFISGPDGPTHHGIYDIGFLYAMPNMIITQPRSAKVLKELMEASVSWRSPGAIRYPNLPAIDLEIDENQPPVKRPIGKGEVLQKGKDLLIIALGHMCKEALEVASLLKEEGIRATVVDPIYLKPFDRDLFFPLFEKQEKIVVLEEHSTLTGLSSIVKNLLIEASLNDLDVLSIGPPDAFIPHGERPKLLSHLQLTPKDIARNILHHFSWTKMSVL